MRTIHGYLLFALLVAVAFGWIYFSDGGLRDVQASRAEARSTIERVNASIETRAAERALRAGNR